MLGSRVGAISAVRTPRMLGPLFGMYSWGQPKSTKRHLACKVSPMVNCWRALAYTCTNKPGPLPLFEPRPPLIFLDHISSASTSAYVAHIPHTLSILMRFVVPTPP